MFRTNVGAASDLTLRHDDTLVGTVFMAGIGDVAYSIGTTESDVGHWEVRATVQGNPQCYAEAVFDVDRPAGSAAGSTDGFFAPMAVAVALLGLGGVWLLRRRRERTPPDVNPQDP